jgi:GTP-binding protein
MITKYILEREPMTFLFLLVDSRHEPQKIDLEFIQFLGENSVPFGIVFTKCDKLSQNKVESGVALYRRVLKKTWDELPIMFLTSSEKKMGKEALLEFVESCLENANQ